MSSLPNKLSDKILSMKQVSHLQLFSVILWPAPQFHKEDLISFNRNNKYDNHSLEGGSVTLKSSPAHSVKLICVMLDVLDDFNHHKLVISILVDFYFISFHFILLYFRQFSNQIYIEQLKVLHFTESKCVPIYSVMQCLVCACSPPC